ncbi:Ig-like domain-containing protein [Mycolicibacterium sphagni]|uniref:Ig-like domain-containing protein n=1 Tax=Mycolicibacterium sphagni TaxID=1786 RepID=UPI0021F3AA21|nr:Ig-like domain-containing protein [Mycolicibacterium sphagni]MCV7178682.1 beta-propeller fold lactonase family protein [Mycolicibacterium sphagni]
MAARPRADRSKARHRRSKTTSITTWLRAGSVALGLGAAMAAGQGIASADNPSSSTPHHSEGSSARTSGTRQPAAQPARHPATTDTRGSDAQPAAGVVIAPTTAHRPSTTQQPLSTATVGPAANSTTRIAATVQPAAAYPAPVTAPVTLAGIVSDVLNWSGLSILDHHLPIPPLPVPDPLAAAWIAVRETEYRINNRYPSAKPTIDTEDPNTGVITGNLNATDPDGDHLTYTVATQPSKGTVTINDDGSFSYTPNATEAASGGTDSFRVTVSDANSANPSSIHGLLGLLGVTSEPTVAVRLTVTAVGTPVATVTINATAGTPDPHTGVTTITVTSSDSANNPVTYTATSSQGTVSPSPTQASTLTFTPAAGYTPADVVTNPSHATDTITITATDTSGATSTKVVTITQTALADTPVPGTPTVGAPATDTGTVTGTANFTDPAGRTLTYTVTSDPSLGTVSLTGNGSFSYTPTTTARTNAATGGPTTDSFTVTATNATGASANETVSVPISPTAASSGPVKISVGTNPEELAITPDGGHLYVTNYASNSVSVISTATNTVTATITVGNSPSAIIMAADGKHVYVNNFADGTVSVISTATNTVTATVTVGANPDALALSADGSTLDVAIDGNNITQAEVIQIDTATNTVRTTTLLGDGDTVRPSGVASVGGTLYVTDYESNYMDVIPSPGTLTGATRIYIGGQSDDVVNPLDPVVGADGSTLYIAERFVSTVGPAVAVVDLGSATATQYIRIPAGVQQIVKSPDGGSLYITNGGSSVSKLDLATGTVTTVATYDDGTGTGIAVSPDGTHLYATNYMSGTVEVTTLT